MAHQHPPGALGEARAPVSGGPRCERPRVLRCERAEPLHRFGRCRSVTRGRKLWVEASEYFVALRALGVGEFQETSWAHKGSAGALGLVPRLVFFVSHPLGDTLSGELYAAIDLQGRRHLQAELELLGPLGIVEAEVVRRPLHADDAGADVPRKRLRPRLVLGVAHRPGFDRIGDEVRDGLQHDFGREQRMDTGAVLVEDLSGPAAIGLGAQARLRRKVCTRQARDSVRELCIEMCAVLFVARRYTIA